MTLDYTTAKALKDAGFPQKTYGIVTCNCTQECRCNYYSPTLSEIIEELWELDELKHYNRSDRQEWVAFGIEQEPWNPASNQAGTGPTPELACANLYLAIHKK